MSGGRGGQLQLHPFSWEWGASFSLGNVAKLASFLTVYWQVCGFFFHLVICCFISKESQQFVIYRGKSDLIRDTQFDLV